MDDGKPLARVYCSGPLFCPEEIAGMTAIAETLEAAGYETFLPHRDGLERFVTKALKDPRFMSRSPRRLNLFASKAVFALDLYQIVECCDSLVMNLNGRVPDEGAVVETAVAFAAGKPLVLYKNDSRAPFHGNDNSMVAGLSYTFTTVNRIDEIPGELRRVARKLERMGGSPYRSGNLPPAMRQVTDFGRLIWGLMRRLRFFQAGSDDEALDRLKRIVKLCETHPAMKGPGWV